MGRAIAGAVVVAIIAVIVFFVWSQKQNQTIATLNRQRTALGQQLAQLKDQNARLNTDLSRIQHEENQLAAQNDLLNKALAKAKATGRVPRLDLPYPPK